MRFRSDAAKPDQHSDSATDLRLIFYIDVQLRNLVIRPLCITVFTLNLKNALLGRYPTMTHF